MRHENLTYKRKENIMTFMDNLKEQIADTDIIYTENGAPGYRSTGKALLDINFAVSSLRSKTDDEIIEQFKAAYYENKLLAIKWLFFYRDIRGGLGERRGFRVILAWLASQTPSVTKALIPLVSEYGRWDDLFPLLDVPSVKDETIGYILKQLHADACAMRMNKPVSLLAKWLPSASTNNPDGKRWRNLIQSAAHMTNKEYRKELSRLRKYLDVTEVKMSANQWDKIQYESVPSRANLLYKNAFLKHDEERRREFLAKLERGETKINSSILFPHDIVHNYMHSSGWSSRVKECDAALESMWQALPDTVNGCGNTLVVADGSGSMYSRIGDTKTRALDVANALAIYFSERSTGEFKDKYITFSSRPQFVDFSECESLKEKLEVALRHDECSNTNIEKVFNLILSTAIRNNTPPEEMPKNILVISDMEFDQGTDGASDFIFEKMKKAYKSAGYSISRLIFWNVNSRTGAIPLRENEKGVALVSGFSVNVCNMVMSGEMDPYKCLVEAINTERYKPVEEEVWSVTGEPANLLDVR